MTTQGALRERVLAASAAWVWLPPDAVEHATAEYRLVLYPHAASVVSSTTDRAVADLVEDVLADLARLDPSRTVLRWWTSAGTVPTSTADDLLALGFTVADTVEVFGADLTDVEPLLARLGTPPDVTVVTCDDADAIRLAGEISARTLGEEPPTPAQLAEKLDVLERGLATGGVALPGGARPRGRRAGRGRGVHARGRRPAPVGRRRPRARPRARRLSGDGRGALPVRRGSGPAHGDRQGPDGDVRADRPPGRVRVRRRRDLPDAADHGSGSLNRVDVEQGLQP